MDDAMIMLLGFFSIGIFILVASVIPMYGAVETVGNVTVIGTNNNALDVFVQDQHTQIIELYFTRTLSNITLLVDPSLGDRTITINSAVAPVEDNIICMKEGVYFGQYEIVGVTSLGSNNYEVDLDMPLDYDYSIAGGCQLKSDDLNVNGAVTPVVFDIDISGLHNDTEWDIYSFGCSITDNLDMDSSKFGGITALSNGLYFRVDNGIKKNIFNVKDNEEIALKFDHLQYDEKAPAGVYGLHFDKNVRESNGVSLRLAMINNESSFFKAVVQDDLTGLTSFKCVARGHLVE